MKKRRGKSKARRVVKEPQDSFLRTRRWEILIIVVILVVGALLRFLYLSDLKNDPLFANPALDAQLHDYWAWGLASGDWSVPENRNDPLITSTPYFRPPGYPHFLAAIYFITGRRLVAPRVFQFCLGLASCFLAFLFARRWFGPAVGATLTGIMSIYWIFIYFEGELLDPVLLVFLLMTMIFALSLLSKRMGFLHGGTAGILLGLSALVRPNILLFVPLAVGWIVWIAFRRGELRKLGAVICGLFLGVVLAIAPATLRNYLVSGELVVISSNGGVNLYIGNNPTADGINAAIPNIENLTSQGGWTCFDYPQVVQGLSRKLGKSMSYSEASRYWTTEALDYIKDHPKRFFTLTAKRAALFWGPNEVGDRDIELARQSSKALRILPLNFPITLSLAVVGAFLIGWDYRRARSRKEEASAYEPARQFEVTVLVVMFIMIYFASFLPFFFNARYRVPILPFLLLFGSYGLCKFFRFIAARDMIRAVVWIAAFASLSFLASIDLVGYDPQLDRWHYQLGNAYREAGKMDLAMTEYSEALRVNPQHLLARNDLATILLRRGKLEEAIQQFEAVLDIDPKHSYARFNLANILIQLRRIDDAIEQYQLGLEINPLDANARVAFGSALLLRGDADQAIAQYHKALELRPNESMAHLALGRALLAQGNANEAVKALREAVRFRTLDPWAHYYLGVGLTEVGQVEEALQHYREALKLDPSFKAASQALETARKRKKETVQQTQE